MDSLTESSQDTTAISLEKFEESWNLFKGIGDSITNGCVNSKEPNTYNLCKGMFCDHDAVCASGCCVASQCNNYYCNGDSQNVFYQLAAFLVILAIMMFVCCKSRKRIKENKRLEQIRIMHTSDLLNHDFPPEEVDDKGRLVLQEGFHEVTL